MNKKVENIKIIMLMIYTFVVLYNPTFFSSPYINYMLEYFYMILVLIFLKSQYKIKGIFYFVGILIGFLCLASTFFVIRALIAGVELQDIINLRIVQSLSIVVTIISICKIEQQLTVWNFDIRKKMKFILNVTMIQACITIIMLIVPNFRTVMLSRFYQYGNGNQFTIAKRVYGIMSNYTFSGSIFHGFLATLSLTMGILYDKKFYLYIPFLILMIVLNGRTGLMIFFLGIIINIIYFAIKNKNTKKMLQSIFWIAIILLIALSILRRLKPESYDFLISGINDVMKYVIDSEKSGNIKILTENFENNINMKTFLFGNGHRIQNSDDIPENIHFEYEYSDMGYLNDMYMGGIVYMLLLYLPLIRFVFSKSKTVKLTEKEKALSGVIEIFSILVVFICNIKGEVFRSGILIGIIVLSKIIVQDKKEEINNEKSVSNNVNT